MVNVADGAVPELGRRIHDLAVEHPRKPAIIFWSLAGTESCVTWEELDRQSNQVARLLHDRGVGPGSAICIGLWNSPVHVLATVAAWKLGALMLPLRAVLPARERNAILDLLSPALVLAEWDDTSHVTITPQTLLDEAAGYPDDPVADAPHPGKAIASGGSTGRPKIIVDPAWHPCRPVYSLSGTGAREGQVQLLAAPMYHNSPFLATYHGLSLDHTLVIMEKFDAAATVDLIERHQVNYAYFPPIIMRRLARLPGIEERDLSSLDAIQSSASPCPAWLKRFWIDLIGAEKVFEVYGSTEGIGSTAIRGDEWLLHPGSVGIPARSEVRILDEAEQSLPPGEIGDVFLRPDGGRTPTFRYIGGPDVRTTKDGFKTVGDLGWVDDDGYLYIAERRVDLIISGGANIYPAEVEAALSEHPGIADVAVIGVPDEEWGRRVHAVVQLTSEGAGKVDARVLDAHCRERIASYKAPKSYEFVTELPRNEAGKIRRSALAAERESGWINGMVWAKEPV